MRKFIAIVLFFTLNIANAQTLPPPAFEYQRDFKKILAQTQERDSSISYQKLLPRFLERDTSLSNYEMLALLIGFTEDTYYKPFEDMEAEQEIFDLNEQKQDTAALEKVLPYLRDHPLSLRALKEASYIYHVRNNKDSADYYMDLVEKIMNAMIYSANGKKPETAIFSLGLADGERFVENIGMKVEKKETDWNKYNHFIEIVDGSKNVDDVKTFYFNINHAKEKVDDDKVDASDAKKDKKEAKKKKDKERKEKDKKAKEEKEKLEKDKKKDKGKKDKKEVAAEGSTQ